MNVLLIVASLINPQSAGVRRVAQEIVKSFGRETIERAEPRVVKLVESYGDDAVKALRRVGAGGVGALEKYGAAGARIVARWGDDGTRLLAAEGDDAVRALAKHGDGAVELMIRHPGTGRELLEHFGEHALRTPLTGESALALSRLAEPIRHSGRLARIFDVVERFGDRACQFLWRNKGTVFAAAVLTAFLRDPQPYIDGVRELVVQPVSEAAQAAVRQTDWTIVFGGLAVALAAYWAAGRALRARKLDSPGPRP